MGKTSRILRLRASLLGREPPLSAQAWACLLGVDTRTVLRDLAYLKEEEKLPVLYDRKLRGYRCEFSNLSTMRESRAKKWGRLMDLIHRIAAQPGQSSQQLAEAMGCTTRTIFRDLRELESLGFPLYHDDGYRFAADAFLPALNLAPRELLSLFLGARLLEGVGGEELGAEARRALEKLMRGIAEDRRPDLSAMRSRLQITPPAEDTGVDLLLELQSVIGNGRQIRLHYLGLQDQQAQERTVDPMGLFGFRQVWYLRAFDHLRGAYRSFRLSRVVSWEQLDTPVVHQANMELQDAVYHRWDVDLNHQTIVQLRVTEALGRWLRENPPHPSQRFENGYVFYDVSDLVAMARWAAGLHGLEVVAPEALRREMALLGSRLQSLYGAALGGEEPVVAGSVESQGC